MVTFFVDESDETERDTRQLRVRVHCIDTQILDVNYIMDELVEEVEDGIYDQYQEDEDVKDRVKKWDTQFRRNLLNAKTGEEFMEIIINALEQYTELRFTKNNSVKSFSLDQLRVLFSRLGIDEELFTTPGIDSTTREISKVDVEFPSE